MHTCEEVTKAGNSTMLIITLNVNDPTIPISSRNRLDFKKQDPTICCLQENYFNNKETNKLKRGEKSYTTLNQKRAKVATLTKHSSGQGHYQG